MNVTRRQIIARGFTGQCPNCGNRSLFQAGTRLKINDRCPGCGMKLDRGDGFFLGPFVINYTVTVVCFIVPVVLLGVFGVLGRAMAFALIVLGAVGLPILLYRRAWSWWLMAYFYLLPQKLPNNREELREDEEE